MNPIMREIPYSFDTERLTIRGPLPGDGDKVRTAVLESQAELKPWMPWAVKVASAKDYEIRVREGQIKYLGRQDFWLLIFLRGTETLIGSSGLHSANWDVPSFEIGYWLHTQHTGQGYITEAVEGICQFAYSQLEAQRLFIRCDSENERSAAVARRCGFTFEGTHRHDSRDHLTNELASTHFFSRLAAK
ncbi:MAG: GNAT family N-acetyltransferase [Ardenticatenaceae bacterium]|nr:GNAT family N-acetyltransferase [Anaerolineales bacterium]MCB9007042.1 GNAT family N-acetyltransferase [Ardenticatenaceae bacterium]